MHVWLSGSLLAFKSPCHVVTPLVMGSTPISTILFTTFPIFHVFFFTKLPQFFWPIKTPYFKVIFCTLVNKCIYFMIVQKFSEKTFIWLSLNLAENDTLNTFQNHFKRWIFQTFEFRFFSKLLTNEFHISKTLPKSFFKTFHQTCIFLPWSI